jgi:hypothetical protein
MELMVEREDLSIASLDDEPGALAAKLTALADAAVLIWTLSSPDGRRTDRA